MDSVSSLFGLQWRLFIQPVVSVECSQNKNKIKRFFISIFFPFFFFEKRRRRRRIRLKWFGSWSRILIVVWRYQGLFILTLKSENGAIFVFDKTICVCSSLSGAKSIFEPRPSRAHGERNRRKMRKELMNTARKNGNQRLEMGGRKKTMCTGRTAAESAIETFLSMW